MTSVTTTRKFMDYLHEPYLFYYLPRFNNKLKLMKKAATKVYVIDNGFVTSKASNISENSRRLGEEPVSPDDYLQDIALYTNADYRSNEDAVKLMTIHQAKGLEFPYVFVMGLNEKKYFRKRHQWKAAFRT